MKKKIISAAALLSVFAVGAAYLSYNLHWLLERQMQKCSVNIGAVLGGLADPRIRLLFLLLWAAGGLLVWYALAMQASVKYKSDMQEITPGIVTPKAEGQGQYGTAHWLSASQLPSVFSVVQVDMQSERLRKLMEHGYDDDPEHGSEGGAA